MAQERRYQSDYRHDDDWSGDWQDWESADRSDYGRGRGWRGGARQRERDQSYRDNPTYGSGRDYGGEGYGRGRDYGSDYPGRNYGRSDLVRGEYGRGGGWRGSDWPRRGSDFGRDDYGEGYLNYGRGYESGFGYPPQAWRGQRYGDRYRGDYGRSESDQGRNGEERSMWDRATDEVSSWFGDEDAERRRQMDHRGRGPKNYTRSDDRIREDVCDRLSDDWSIDASEIDVSVNGSEVTLSGTVNDRRQRRRAEDCAEQVSGVKHVQNNMRVKDQSTADASGMTNRTATSSTPSGSSSTGSGGSTTSRF